MPLLLRRAPRAVGRILIWPFYRIVSLVLRAFDVRFFCITVPHRIGHVALEPDCFLKEVELGLLRPARTIVLIKKGLTPANACLMAYWRARFPVVSNRVLTAFLYPLRKHPAAWVEARRYCVSPKVTAASYAIYAAWGNRPPVIELKADHAARGEAALRELGVPEGAWFVCVHSRERGYAPYDDDEHAFRNSSIEAYLSAIQEIVARGGWCIRVGDPSSPPLEPMPGVIDYRHSPLRSDWMDVFLCARCRFFLGTSSGLFLVSSIFGVPVALTNMAPMGAAYAPGVNDISMPKLLADADGTPWPFPRAFASKASNLAATERFGDAGLRLIDNSPEDIRDLVIEMLERLEGRARYTQEDEALQAAFRRLLRPGHYSYGAVSRIGRGFLRRHADLLNSEREPAARAAEGAPRSRETADQSG